MTVHSTPVRVSCTVTVIEQTAKATGQISLQISSIQASTKESVGAIKDIGDTTAGCRRFPRPSPRRKNRAWRPRKSRAMRSGRQRAPAGVVKHHRCAAQSRLCAHQVLSAAQSLSSESSRLKVEVSNFLGSVRAA